MTLTEFLLARIAEDEVAARDVWVYHSSPWSTGPGPAGWSIIRSTGVVDDDFSGKTSVQHHTFVLQMDTTSTAEHIARHDPTRVLAECEAKRRIVEEHPVDYSWQADRFLPACPSCRVLHPCPTLRALTAVYSDHPDYDEAWRP